MKFTFGILSILLILQYTPSYCSEHNNNPHIIKLGRAALPGNHVVHCSQDALYITYHTSIPCAEPAPIKKIALNDDQDTLLNLTGCSCVVFGFNKLKHPDKLYIHAIRSTLKAIDLESPEAYEPPNITLCKQSTAYVISYENTLTSPNVSYFGRVNKRPKRSLLLEDLCKTHPAKTSDQ